MIRSNYRMVATWDGALDRRLDLSPKSIAGSGALVNVCPLDDLSNLILTPADHRTDLVCPFERRHSRLAGDLARMQLWSVCCRQVGSQRARHWTRGIASEATTWQVPQTGGVRCTERCRRCFQAHFAYTRQALCVQITHTLLSFSFSHSPSLSHSLFLSLKMSSASLSTFRPQSKFN